jgi:hypothetical protein
MKTAWNILAIVAVANLLALAGFVGWLKASDRLDLDRARAVRSMLARTISAEKAEADAEKQKAEAQAKAAEAARRAAQPPLTAEQRVALRLEATELDRQRAERLRREVEDLQQALATERAALDRDRAEFNAQRLAFEQATADERTRLTDEQFQKTLGVLSALKAKEAVTLLRQMLSAPGTTPPESGPIANGASVATPPATASQAGMGQVVAYLDAMDDGPRNKIMTELTRTDPALATELLEQLRRRTQFAAVPSAAP